MRAYIPVDTRNLRALSSPPFFPAPQNTEAKPNILPPRALAADAPPPINWQRRGNSIFNKGRGRRREGGEMPCRPPLARFTLNPFLSVAANAPSHHARFILQEPPLRLLRPLQLSFLLPHQLLQLVVGVAVAAVDLADL